MEAQRKTALIRTLNDMVDEIHGKLYDHEEYSTEYRRLLLAVWDSETVEGSLSADNYKAADMIREYAKDNGYPEIANKNWATIVKALGVVLRRLTLDRNSRRHMVDGVVMPHGDDNNGSL